jgi:hypothetical protein
MSKINDDVFEYEGSGGFTQCISGFGRNTLDAIEEIVERHGEYSDEDRERIAWHVGELVRWCRGLNHERLQLKEKLAKE